LGAKNLGRWSNHGAPLWE